MKKFICFVLMLCISLSLLAACAPADDPQKQTQDPTELQGVIEMPKESTFGDTYTDLAVELFRQSANASPEKNMLISPLSIQLALAMTANGADGQTRQEMESLISGGIPLEELNAYLHAYMENLPADEKAKLSIANSIWFRDEDDRLTVDESFLQTNANYYCAEIFKEAFDNKTVEKINRWVNQNTDGMIDQIIDQIDELTMMYLINAMAFDAEWAEPYYETAIRDGSFTDISGKEQTVTMMHGSETTYLSDGKATGFIKPYSGGKYSFAVLLPNEDVALYDYINSLTAESLTKTLTDAEECEVVTQLPKFSYEYELTMNDVLKEMGMHTAFDPDKADLSKLGHFTNGNLCISQVLHKTFIQVDGMGTKAGAVTVVTVYAAGAMAPDPQIKEVIVDRPFVYMILDNETNLPLFIGCVTEITE